MAVDVYRIVSGDIHPLLLGMDREQISQIMGEDPTISASRMAGEQILRFAQARVSMRDGRAVEVSLVPPAKVLFEGKVLFDDPSVWPDLVAADGDARETLGFIVLPQLRLALTGFHDGDRSQLSVSAFEPGRWDHFQSEMRPLRF